MLPPVRSGHEAARDARRRRQADGLAARLDRGLPAPARREPLEPMRRALPRYATDLRLMPPGKRMPPEIAADMPATERLALFCIVSRTDLARVTGDTVTMRKEPRRLYESYDTNKKAWHIRIEEIRFAEWRKQ